MDANQPSPQPTNPPASGPYSDLSDKEVIEQILLIDKLINQNRLDLLGPQRTAEHPSMPPTPGGNS